MKKFIIFISVLHIFNCGTALASWTTIDVPGAFGTHVCGIDGDLEWSLNERGLTIKTPEKKPCEHAFVFKIVRK